VQEIKRNGGKESRKKKEKYNRGRELFFAKGQMLTKGSRGQNSVPGVGKKGVTDSEGRRP